MLAVENSEAKTLEAATADAEKTAPAQAKPKRLPARAKTLEASSIQL
jgi:hypothetical protein